jgi:hypothetical protein
LSTDLIPTLVEVLHRKPPPCGCGREGLFFLNDHCGGEVLPLSPTLSCARVGYTQRILHLIGQVIRVPLHLHREPSTSRTTFSRLMKMATSLGISSQLTSALKKMGRMGLPHLHWMGVPGGAPLQGCGWVAQEPLPSLVEGIFPLHHLLPLLLFFFFNF